jgi:hypothetical protein
VRGHGLLERVHGARVVHAAQQRWHLRRKVALETLLRRVGVCEAETRGELLAKLALRLLPDAPCCLLLAPCSLLLRKRRRNLHTLAKGRLLPVVIHPTSSFACEPPARTARRAHLHTAHFIGTLVAGRHEQPDLQWLHPCRMQPRPVRSDVVGFSATARSSLNPKENPKRLEPPRLLVHRAAAEHVVC